MVNMLKFKEGGADEFRKYVEAATPLLEQAGGRVVFRLYDHVATVIDGGGLVPNWDGVYITEWPSPAALVAFSTSEAHREVHAHRAAALEATEMYACQASWTTSPSFRQGAAPRSTPNLDMDMSVPRRLAAEKQKDKAAMAAILGRPETMMGWVQDDRFASGRIWQLNLLKYEGGGKAEYYAEYGDRARSHIESTMKKEGSGGGGQMVSQKVFSLLGPEYDAIAIMQYPSRAAFIGYATGSDRKEKTKENTDMQDGFVLRAAGLAVQGLVCLKPDSDLEAVQDPDGPKLQPTPKL